MKKIWIVLIGLAFISGLAFTQSTEEKPDKQLAPAREILLNEMGVIQAFVVSIGEKSGTVTKSDLLQLQKMINNFSSLEERLLKEISSLSSIFTRNDAPKVAFISECEDIVVEYFSGSFWYHDDDVQTIKRFFMKYTGKEMEIERAKSWGTRVLVGILVGFFAAFILGMLSFGITDENCVVGWGVGIVIFATWFMICLFVF